MEQFTFAGQAEAPAPAVTQDDPQRRFQLAHVGADGRGRKVEFALGIGEALMAYDADEDAQEFQVRQCRSHGLRGPKRL
ncbi:hypothetical protein D3C81_1855390 [compost metagenome]